MPRPRRKPRLKFSNRRARRNNETVITGPDTPTIDELMNKGRRDYFSVRDDDGDLHIFNVGMFVLVLPEDTSVDIEIELHEYWVAKILDIRVGEDNDDAWAKVQWCWSGEEVAEEIKSFDASHCAQLERLLSNTYDYVSCFSFSGVVDVKRYDEDRLDPKDVSPEGFFWRHEYLRRQRRVTPKPTALCMCKRPYNPDHDNMHFCPRPACRRSYHRACLVKARYIDRDTEPRHLRLLASSPDTDDFFELSSLSDDGSGTPPPPAELLSAFPADLVELAGQPIVKGVDSGGVVGNVKSVVTARRMIYEALKTSEPIPNDWASQVDTVSASPSRNLPVLCCPKCRGPWQMLSHIGQELSKLLSPHATSI